MSTLAQPTGKGTARRSAVLIFALLFAGVPVCAGQYHGGVNPGYAPHFSGPPFPTGGPPIPSGGPPVPGYSPGYTYHYHYGRYFNGNGYNGGRGYRGNGWGYVVPYYYPADDSAYGYDYVGAGPDLYSGPPIGPNDPTLHMIVEQPPVDYPYGPPPDSAAYGPPPAVAAPPAPAPEVKPGQPTVLVFRNGKQQEVTNYAIMGDTLYVFDQGKKKIALADLDIPATVQANDDRGMEFKVPPAPAKKKTATPAAPGAQPDKTSDGQPPNIAALVP